MSPCGGGTVVTEEGERRADIGIIDGLVAAVEPSLPPGAHDIDASGLHVLPGGVDSHAHIEQKTSTGLTPVDNFYSASVAALCGGTTTIVPFACQHRGQRIRDVVEEYRCTAVKAAVDYAMHVIVTDPAEAHALEDLRVCFASGYTSVKVYMTYDALRLKDDDLLDVLAICRAHGAIVMVHAGDARTRTEAAGAESGSSRVLGIRVAESNDLIGWITRKLLKAELVLPRFHAAARPAIAEREATHRAITFAEYLGTPLLVVHVSSAEAAAEISAARARGLAIFGETCPQYLVLTEGCLCETHGEKFLCSPPLRTEFDQQV